MIRDKDLIREILLYCESKNEAFRFYFVEEYNEDAGPTFPGYKQGDLAGHFKLLIEDDYLDGYCSELVNGRIDEVVVNSITMKGHDLLDTIRDQGIWAEIKKELGIVGESWSLELLAKLGIKILAKKLGL